MIHEKLEKLILTTYKDKKNLILEYQEKISKLGAQLIEFAQRNQDGVYKNHKIHYLLYDLFTFVNTYAKTSKNKRVMTEGHDDDNIMKVFGLNEAVQIANKININLNRLKELGFLNPVNKKKDRLTSLPNRIKLFKKL